MNSDDRNIKTCDECKSEFYENSSLMQNLCPECSHIIYYYENCEHVFKNDRCVKCFWNGNSSDYLRNLKE